MKAADLVSRGVNRAHLLAGLAGTLKPPLVSIEINDVCASLCGHCSFGHERYQRLVPVDWLISAIEQAYEYGCRVLTIAAREPFLARAAPRTIAVLRAAREMGYESIGAITSARFLEDACAHLKAANLTLDCLDVSVDGLGALHDQLRGVSEWSVIEKELDRTRYREVVHQLGCSITLQRQNADSIVDLLDWLAGSGEFEQRVDGALVAAVSMNGRNSSATALEHGQFRRALIAIEKWYRSPDAGRLSTALELTPNSVPELRELIAERIISPEDIRISRHGMPLTKLSSGLPLRVMAGVFSLGRVMRISADGRVVLYYGQWERRYGRRLQKEAVRELLQAEHGTGRCFEPIVDALMVRPELLDHLAWTVDGDPLALRYYETDAIQDKVD